MKVSIIQLFFLLLLGISATQGHAQATMNPGWDAEKIKGVRNLVYPHYKGQAFLTEKWVTGQIVFEDGEVAGNLNLRYSSYKDELIYFNERIGAQIVIDKATLKGFSFTDPNSGEIRTFRKIYYDNYLKSDRYFEVLSEGETELLAYRKVNLITTFAYKDETGILKNMEYTPEYAFYFYTPEKGFTLVRMNRESLLSKFDKSLQKPIKKLIRRSHIMINSEATFVRAWEVVKQSGYHLSL